MRCELTVIIFSLRDEFLVTWCAEKKNIVRSPQSTDPKRLGVSLYIPIRVVMVAAPVLNARCPATSPFVYRVSKKGQQRGHASEIFAIVPHLY